MREQIYNDMQHNDQWQTFASHQYHNDIKHSDIKLLVTSNTMILDTVTSNKHLLVTIMMEMVCCEVITL